jgi:hypothetical protein
MIRKTLGLLLILTAGLSPYLQAQTPEAEERFPFDPDITYSNVILSPAEFLGYELGEEYTPHYQVLAYFRYLAGNTDRMIVQTYGETYEGRDLIYATITSSDNHNRLNEIRQANLDLANPGKSGQFIGVGKPYLHVQEPNCHNSVEHGIFTL